MMTKRLLALFLALILCLSFVGCGNKDSEEEKKDISPILYKVTDDEGHTLWLFGSIHMGSDDFYPLPDYVMDAYKGSDALAVEADILALENDVAAQMVSMQKLLYTDGTTIKDHLPKETYEAAVEILTEHKLYNSMLDYYMPALWSSTVETLMYEELGFASDKGVDRHLLTLAYEDGKEIREVESVSFQYGMLSGFSEDLQAYMLENSIAQYGLLNQAQGAMQTLMDLWASGNETVFAMYLQTATEFEGKNEENLYNEYNKAMIVNRNKTMTEYAIDALESGDEVFVCVGAAHVIGSGAMADLLAKEGYTVERVK